MKIYQFIVSEPWKKKHKNIFQYIQKNESNQTRSFKYFLIFRTCLKLN